MKKLFIVFMTLIAVNLVSAQTYDKSYIKYKQKMSDGKWGEKEPSESYIKFDLISESIHIHDDAGIHLDVHEKISEVEVKPVMIGDWERYDMTVIVDKDYNYGISEGTEIRFYLWRNYKTDSAAYTIITKYGEVFYSIYKHESVDDGILSGTVYFK